jgi:hypothetical protein
VPPVNRKIKSTYKGHTDPSVGALKAWMLKHPAAIKPQGV